MANGKFIAYFRVSTDKQGRSGLGLEAQRKTVADYLNGGNWELTAEFVEVESGKRSDRPQLAKAIDAAKKAKATLIIAKLDRLARNVHFVSGLMEAGIEFVAADLPTTDKFMLHIYAAVAEQEARAISQRTKAALQAAKARGKRLGWANPNRADNAKATTASVSTRIAKADNFAGTVADLIAGLRATKSFAEIAKELNNRQIKTARGGAWHPTTVKNVIDRLAA
jgi:DNA invertase Pin-like site-specific DNA recombinase